jgi:hypothetical protein
VKGWDRGVDIGEGKLNGGGLDSGGVNGQGKWGMGRMGIVRARVRGKLKLKGVKRGAGGE